jgi:hypothetical protein
VAGPGRNAACPSRLHEPLFWKSTSDGDGDGGIKKERDSGSEGRALSLSGT